MLVTRHDASYVIKYQLILTFKTCVFVLACTHALTYTHMYTLTLTAIAFWAIYTYRYSHTHPLEHLGSHIPMAQACVFSSAQEGSVVTRYYRPETCCSRGITSCTWSPLCQREASSSHSYLRVARKETAGECSEPVLLSGAVYMGQQGAPSPTCTQSLARFRKGCCH